MIQYAQQSRHALPKEYAKELARLEQIESRLGTCGEGK